MDASLPTADLSRITEDLTALVRIPSVTGSEDEIQAEMARQMRASGLDVTRLEEDLGRLAAEPGFPGTEVERSSLPIVVGHVSGSRPGPSVMLTGHVDVVPPGDPGSWARPPFEPRVHDGRMYGRGTCDMKGGLVAALEAIRLVLSSTAELSGSITMLAVPSEEDGGAGTFAALKAGVTADLAVLTEPTGLEVVVAHAGAITFRLTVPGKAAHASTRREGVSALDKLAVLVEALRIDEERRNSAETDPVMTALGLPYPTIIGTVRGGDWPSTVMDLVVAEGRYGVRLGQNGGEAAEELSRAIAAAWEADDFLSAHPVGLEVWGGRFDSVRIPPDHPLPVGLIEASEAVTGRPAPTVGAPYGADMRLLVLEGRIPTVMYGPGRVNVAHAADEHVEIAEVGTCADVLARWMLGP